MNGPKKSDVSVDVMKSEQPSLKKCNIPLKACIKCGNVWKLTHYCPAESVTCKKCYRTGHLSQHCFTYKNKDKTKSTAIQMQVNANNNKTTVNNNELRQQEQPIKCDNQPTTAHANKPNCSSDQFLANKIKSSAMDSKRQADSSAHSEMSRNKNDLQENKHQNKPRMNNGTRRKILSKSEVEDLKNSARLFYQHKKYEKALIYYSLLIEHFPNDAENYQNRSICLMMLEQLENALVDALRAIELKPKLINSYATLITCSVKLGYIMEAECHLKKLLQLNPNNSIIPSEQIKLIKLQQYLEKEKTDLNNENYQDALENVNKCLLISPKDLRLKIRRAEYLAILKRYDESDKVIGEILEKDPNNLEVKYILAIRIYDLNVDEALNYFNEVLRIDPDNSKIANFKKNIEDFIQKKTEGNNAFTVKEYERAHESYSSALKIDPNHAGMKIQLYFNMAQASWNLHNYKRAIEEYTKVITINSLHVYAVKQRGKCYLQTGDFEKAIADFTRVINLNPTDPDCLSLINEAETELMQSQNSNFEFLGKTDVEK